LLRAAGVPRRWWGGRFAPNRRAPEVRVALNVDVTPKTTRIDGSAGAAAIRVV
jgi:hypothetical protein